MPSSNLKFRHTIWLVSGLALMFAVVWLAPAFHTVQGLASYLPVHIFAETFSIVISMLVFGVAWNAYSIERPSNIVILACALLSVGLIDFAHMLSFKGMSDFITPSGPEKAINLWLSGRLLAALALLVVALRPWQPLQNPRTRYGLLVGSFFITVLVVWAGLFYPQNWPRTFIAGQGLTPFKIGAEYAIIAILLIPAVLFYLQARRQQSDNVVGLFAATVITILSELCFTLYSDVADVFNLLGHLYKIVAYAFIYGAVFVVSVREPFKRLDAEFAENLRIAQELRAASLYTRSLIEASLDPLVMISADGKITDVNHATELVTGRSRPELMGTDFSDYFTEPEKAREVYRKVFLEGAVTNYPLALRHYDGHITDVLYNASLYRNERGEVLGMFAAARDVTERNQAEEALRVNEERLHLATTAGNIGVWDWDVAKNILTWDESMYVLYGLAKDEFGGAYDAWIRTLHPDDRQFTDGEIQAALRGEREYAPEFRIIRPDGTVLNIKASSKTYRDLEGKPIRMIGTNFDITALKRIEGELRKYKDHLEEEVQSRTTDLVQARNAAETANRAKSIFLANMSHELRTPLNAILGFSNLMRKAPSLQKDQRDNLDIINRSGEYLLTLINDVLEMAKIEAGRVQLDNLPLDLGKLVRDVTDMMQVRAQEKGLQLLLDQSSEFPRYIKGDEARLRQVLINLVGNAVKFTQEGGVTVRFGMKPNGPMKTLLIEVEDTGPGMKPEDQDKIFEPFVQVGELAAQKGTGLGLTITRQFIELMGGTINLVSIFGTGSIFRVELPVDMVAACDVANNVSTVKGDVVSLAPGQPEYRILIVEDQLENQLLLTQLMESIGLTVKVADNGQQALGLFQSWQPHLIWMDRRMPVMDGLEATRRIRQLPGGKDVKIVAVTASAFMEQRDEMLAAGMDDFVRKPYRFNEIYETLNKQLGLQYIYADANAAEEASDVELNEAMLAVLPQELRDELRAALESLEDKRISAVIGQVASLDPKLHRTMSRLAENFDYPAILKLLPAK
ncbi:MAG: MASE3 domain-containing protein [Gallionella sp.]|nr:MASE3 domain-containing protein [Gallionella sp.]